MLIFQTRRGNVPTSEEVRHAANLSLREKKSRQTSEIHNRRDLTPPYWTRIDFVSPFPRVTRARVVCLPPPPPSHPSACLSGFHVFEVLVCAAPPISTAVEVALIVSAWSWMLRVRSFISGLLALK